MAAFYIKQGNDAFSPLIKTNSIILDNAVSTTPSTITGSSTTNRTNGISVNYTISSKQNTLDYWISDVDYLQYTKIRFYVANSKQQATKLIAAIQAGLIQLGIFQYSENPLYKDINLIDIVDTQQITQQEYSFEVEQTITFNELDVKEDIILIILPYVDLFTYFKENGFDPVESYRLVENFLKLETHQYNVLVNNKTINDSNSKEILSDVREIKELNFNLLSMLPPPTQEISLFDNQTSYLSETFNSLVYSKKTINNYFFFNFKKFIEQNCAIKKLFKGISHNKINDILIKNNSIFFEIYKNEEEEKICAFSCGTTEVNDGGIGKTTTINELNTPETIFISFKDDFPKSKNTSFYYKIKVSFIDPFIKNYYDTSYNQGSGRYFDILNNLKIVQDYIENPNNSNSKTLKFQTQISSPPIAVKNQLIKDFFDLYNLFGNKEISEEKIQKISSALDFKVATITTYNDFISFVNISMTQIEQYFISYNQTKTTFIKNDKKVNFKLKDFFFTRDIKTSNLIKYYNEYSKNNSIDQYDLQMEDSTIDSTNNVSYKIINSVLNCMNDQYTYDTNYEQLSNLVEMKGTTIEAVTDITNILTKELFASSNTTNSVIQKATSTNKSTKKQLSQSTEDRKSSLISNILNKISDTNSTLTDSLLKFQIYFLNDMEKEFLVPQISTVFYDVKTKQWQNLSLSNTKGNKSYLAKTIYSVGTNIFSTNKLVPVIEEEYFILIITNSSVPIQQQNNSNNTANQNQ